MLAMNVFIFFLMLLGSVECYKILVLAPLPIRSLGILGEGIVRNLINAGHEVTFITVYPLKKHNYGNKLRQIDVSDNIYSLPDDGSMNIGSVMNAVMPSNDLYSLQVSAFNSAIFTLENEYVKMLLEDPREHFDAIIAELYEIELYSAFSLVYDCPMIWSFSMGVQLQALRLIDQAPNPAYTADYLSSNVYPFTFQQRLEELWTQFKWNYLKRFQIQPKEEAEYKKYFGPLLALRGRKLPNYEELLYNASLIFCNEHHATGNLPSTPQNLKFVGGQHIESPTKPLPKDLQSLMDNATDGVIYFSMGSTWKSKDIPKVVVEGLLKIFGELKQIVIWKYEDELPNIPKNVHVMKWAPQPSILAHPNCLFFITHGGLLSSTEAIHFGVPIIGIPIYFDQFINVKRAVTKGYAILVTLTFNLPSELKPAIRTMLKDSRYRKKAAELSNIYHDRPLSPSRELVHWVEHVIRTKGAPHLRSPSMQLSFLQKYYLDFIIRTSMGIYVFILMMKKLCCTREPRQFVR